MQSDELLENKLTALASTERPSMQSDPIDVESKSNLLGAIFIDYPVTVEAKKRIGTMLSAKVESLPKYVFYKYAPRSETYKQAEKREKIDGFRKGTEAYKDKLIQRLIEHINNSKAANHENCWALYQNTACEFVINELKSLDQLLGNTTCYDESHDASLLMTLICSNAFEFEVNAQEVRKLYEVWWIERVNDLEDILSLCSKVDPIKIQGKQIASLATSVEVLKNSLEKLTTEIAKDKLTRITFEKEATNNFNKVEKAVAAVESISEKTAQAITNYSKNSDARLESVEERQKKTDSIVTSIEGNVSPEKTRKIIDQSLKASSEENAKALALSKLLQSQEFDQLQTILSTKIDELQQQFTALASQVEDLQEKSLQHVGGSVAYKSPLSRSMAAGVHSFKISKEIEFVNSWAAMLSKKQKLSISLEELVAYHCLFLTNNIVVTDYRLAESWINCLGWSSFTRQIVASPLWSCEEDWADGAHHLFHVQTSKRTPRILVIHNFDVGITDCYLIPAILLWSLTKDTNDHLTKLLLIPSGEQTTLNPQILEHAALIRLEDATMAQKLHFSTALPSIPSFKAEIPVGVDPKFATQWAQLQTTLVYDLDDCIQKPFNLTLNQRLVSNFQRTVSSANRFFKEPSAVNVGMHHHILPWIKLKDSSIYGAICSRVTQLLDI